LCEINVFVKKRVIYMCYNIINEIHEIMSDSRDRVKRQKKGGD